MINYDYPAPWLYTAYRSAIRMTRAYKRGSHARIVWQERAADYRLTIVDKMRQRQGWSLHERIVGARHAS